MFASHFSPLIVSSTHKRIDIITLTGTPLPDKLEGLDIDFYRLFRQVRHFGGARSTTIQQKWRHIYGKLGYPPLKNGPRLLKDAYKQYPLY